ncbi:hypothetical protein AFLA70_865g000071, partial [Aspergillus flavus AF70]
PWQPTLPTLQEVLNRASPAPYTLNSLVEFLARNDHLQPLEFILEARRYRTAYLPSQRQLKHLAMLWHRLVSVYILPGSQCDIKLADDALSRIQIYVRLSTLPPVEIIDFTIMQVHVTMAGSIFLLYLNER